MADFFGKLIGMGLAALFLVVSAGWVLGLPLTWETWGRACAFVMFCRGCLTAARTEQVAAFVKESPWMTPNS